MKTRAAVLIVAVLCLSGLSACSLKQVFKRKPVEAAAPAEPQVSRVQAVALAQANLRQGPAQDSDKIAQLAQGAKVIQLEKRGDWIRVYVPDTGATGWLRVSVVK